MWLLALPFSCQSNCIAESQNGVLQVLWCRLMAVATFWVAICMLWLIVQGIWLTWVLQGFAHLSAPENLPLTPAYTQHKPTSETSTYIRDPNSASDSNLHLTPTYIRHQHLSTSDTGLHVAPTCIWHQPTSDNTLHLTPTYTWCPELRWCARLCQHVWLLTNLPLICKIAMSLEVVPSSSH